MTSASFGRVVRCPVCGAPQAACSHAPTDDVTPLDNPLLRQPVPNGGGMALKTYKVRRPEYGGAETYMNLNDADVKTLEALGAEVTAVSDTPTKQAAAPANKARTASNK